MNGGQGFVKRVRAVGGYVEYLSRLEGDYHHPGYDAAARHFPPDVLTKLELHSGDIGDGIQKPPSILSAGLPGLVTVKNYSANNDTIHRFT